MALPDSLDPLGLDRREELDLLDLQDTDLPDHKVCRVFRAILVHRAQLDILDHRAYRVYRVYRDGLALLVQLVSLVQPVPHLS